MFATARHSVAPTASADNMDGGWSSAVTTTTPPLLGREGQRLPIGRHLGPPACGRSTGEAPGLVVRVRPRRQPVAPAPAGTRGPRERTVAVWNRTSVGPSGPVTPARSERERQWPLHRCGHPLVARGSSARRPPGSAARSTAPGRASIMAGIGGPCGTGAEERLAGNKDDR